MSIYKSYFKRNDTLIFNSYTNTGRNPVVELFFGRVDNLTQDLRVILVLSLILT